MPANGRRGPGRPAATSSTETRSSIIAAAREVFAGLGFAGTTLQAVADRAGLTRPAINHYFADKQELFRAAVADTDQTVIAVAAARAAEATTLVDRVVSFLDTAVEIDADRSMAAFQITAAMEASRYPGLLPDDAPARNVRAFLSAALTYAVERGELAADADIPELVEMLAVVLFGSAIYVGFIDDHDDPTAVSARLKLLLADRLHPPPGE